MREYWILVPEVLKIAHRWMRVVKGNPVFTTSYDIEGLTLAAIGNLLPVLAAAAQSLPDIGIMGNSDRLLKQKWARKSPERIGERTLINQNPVIYESSFV